MPKWLHDKAARAAKKKGLTGEAFRAYVYSVLRKYEKSKRKGVAKP